MQPFIQDDPQRSARLGTVVCAAAIGLHVAGVVELPLLVLLTCAIAVAAGLANEVRMRFASGEDDVWREESHIPGDDQV